MNEKRRGLGRGLGALIPTAPAEETQGGADDAPRTFSGTITAPAPSFEGSVGVPAES